MSRMLQLLSVLLIGNIALGAQQRAGRITRIEFQPATADEGGGVFISLMGSGTCAYTLDYGDGNTERRTADLPDRVKHTFPGDGEYLVVATPEAPCEGVARAKLDVRAINRGVWGLSAEAGPDTQNAEMLVTINGRGECTVTMDYGDGTIDKVSATLPATRSHKYGKPGVYELKATAELPCRGEAGLKVEISRVGLPASGFRLPASGSRLPASGSRLPAPGFRLPASGFRLPPPGFRLPASDCARLPASGFRLPSPESRSPEAPSPEAPSPVRE
jgi:hypothetical protein